MLAIQALPPISIPLHPVSTLKPNTIAIALFMVLTFASQLH
jgi:hypothetical protein